jgi:hypothetical protein
MMGSIRKERILLSSARPEAYESLSGGLGRTGVNVRVARHPDRALELFRSGMSSLL